MKNNSIRIRLSDRRLNKLRLYAVEHDKNMTQVIEELIDLLPEPTITVPKGTDRSPISIA
ncbi:hypothetical protein NUACC21_46610 [Scytonema sp. NUACC21]